MIESLSLLAEGEGGLIAGLFGVILFLIYVAVIVAIIAGMWKMFVKAGKPGWACIVPIYNMIVLLEIVGRPIWWVLLMFIPCVGLVIYIIVLIDLAKSFGQSAAYAVGLPLLGFIFYPMLGFGSARYQGPAAATA